MANERLALPFQQDARVPDLIKLGLYGILGGIVGKPVSLAFRDFPPDVVIGIWRSLARLFPAGQVSEVWSQVDLQQIKRKIHEPRVVFVYPSNSRFLCSNVLDWVLEHRRGSGKPLPSVLSIYHRLSSETPGASLVVNGSSDVEAELAAWCQAEAADPIVQHEQAAAPQPAISCNRLMRAVDRAASVGNMMSLRDISIIDGLVAGAAYAGAILDKPDRPRTSIEATPDHYAEIRRLLTSPSLRTIHQPYDDITLQMVARANAYLRLKVESQSTFRVRSGIAVRGGSKSTVDKTTEETARRPCAITRRELVDLGNPGSGIARQLIAHLAGAGDFNALQQIGVEIATQPAPPHACAPSQLGLDHLLRSMTSWTYKKVRTRFDRLQSEGLIEARRAAHNGPVEYLLPEEITRGKAEFSHLPDPKEVQKQF